jgi:uncharacterized spore protein YtfJ
MYYFIFIFLFIILIGYLLYVKTIAITFQFDSEENNINAHLKWLSPLFKAEVKMLDFKPFIIVLLFNKKVYAKAYTIKKRKQKDLMNYRSLHLEDTKVEVFYGLNNPFSTCIANSIVNGILILIKSYSDDIVFLQHPDILAGRQYVIIQANTNLNLAKTLIKLVRRKYSKKQVTGENKMDQMNLTDNIDTLFHSLENFTQKEGVIGKAVTQNEKTFMPVVSITVGYGSGNVAMGKAAAGTDNGSGALGLGAKLCTEAILIIDNQQNVSILPMNAAGSQIIDKIPQIISGMKQGQPAAQ